MTKKVRIILLATMVIFVCILAIYFYTKDEKIHALKRYNSETKETNLLQYVIREGDTIIHGKSIYYNRKGNKTNQNNWVNGKINGKSISYYENGNVESITYMKSSEIRIEALWNYSDGSIERYVMYDDIGEPAFIIFFDKQGNVKNYDGLPLIETFQYKIAHKEQFKIKTNQHLKIGDTLKYKYLIANIPKAHRNFKIKLLDSDNSKIKRIITKNPPLEINVNEIITKKGINSIQAIVEYRIDDKYKTIINDTISFDVVVH
jgi:antitoxin component YwqK of YwqJK toxin-antitoxin module